MLVKPHEIVLGLFAVIIGIVLGIMINVTFISVV